MNLIVQKTWILSCIWIRIIKKEKTAWCSAKNYRRQEVYRTINHDSDFFHKSIENTRFQNTRHKKWKVLLLDSQLRCVKKEWIIRVILLGRLNSCFALKLVPNLKRHFMTRLFIHFSSENTWNWRILSFRKNVIERFFIFN